MKLKDVVYIMMGQSPKGSSYNTKAQGIPLLNGPTEFGTKYPTETQWTKSPTKICKKNDLLFCVRGNTLGRMNWANKEYCIGRGLCAIHPKSDMNIQLIFYYLLLKGIEILYGGSSTTFPNVSKDRLENYEIPLMPSKEQEQIVTQIEQGFSLIENTQQIVSSTLQQLEIMKMSILKQAFEGKLVPQDPNDEPASVLLERIQKEKLKIRQ